LKDIRYGAADSGPSYFAPMVSKLDGQTYLYFTATDGLGVKALNNIEGYGGAQMWVTDGTSIGTRRALLKTANDFYIDRPSMDAKYPATMISFKDGLYFSASYGAHDYEIPDGGFVSDNIDNVFGISQAAVITDVDTPTEGNVTVTLTVDQGFIVLKDKLNLNPSSPIILNILLAEESITDSSLISIALLALGHNVVTVTSGKAAYDKILEKINYRQELDSYNENVTDPHINDQDILKYQQFDCILMSIQFNSNNNNWDGLQAIRMIRQFENIIGLKRIPIIAMSKLRVMINDQSEALHAGADLYLYQQESNYVPNAERNNRIITFNGTTISAGLAMLKDERSAANAFATVVTNFVHRKEIKLNITSLVENIPDVTLSERAAMPGLSVGNKIILDGSLKDINSALRNVYYFARQGSYGNVSLQITVVDRPLPCIASRSLLYSDLGRNAYTTPWISLSTISINNLNTSAPSSISHQLCDHNKSQIVNSVIPIYVQPVNQPPEITIYGSNISCAVDAVTPIPTIEVSDIDHNRVTLLSSFGYDVLPPISVILSAKLGRISMTFKDGITFPQGKGDLDRLISIRGGLDAVNKALRSLLYVCRLQDGCFPKYFDTISIKVNDEGFTGKGGPLSASATIKVFL
jgi:CheY-like chemotaxis protein